MLRITASAGRLVYWREKHAQIRRLWIEKPAILAIVAPQQGGGRVVNDKVVAETVG
jgi:hypothetical protein